jgi:hypothetical protein
MFRSLVITLGVVALIFSLTSVGDAYTSQRGTSTGYSAGGACMPTGCPPISVSPYAGMQMMPTKISKVKAQPMCGPMPCPPPMCGPAPCGPMKAPVLWY